MGTYPPIRNAGVCARAHCIDARGSITAVATAVDVRYRTDTAGTLALTFDVGDKRATLTVVSSSAVSSIAQYGVPAVTGIGHEEKAMGMNKDQVTGRIKETKGKIKEVAGKIVGNKKLEAKGKGQKVLGKAQAKFGDVKKRVKDTKKRV
jgi:uncharacterized protein YjbJ (UPF0337 family)